MANGNNHHTTGDGLIVADVILPEPESKGLLGKRTRPVPPELFPKADQVLVLRGEVDFTQLSWGQVPDPMDPRWLDSRAATLVRRKWREEVVFYVPSSSPDRDFTVVVPFTSEVVSPVTFLASASPTSIDVYRDHIGTVARDLGKRFDARQSDQLETLLRVRLKAWMRMRRSEVPGVAVQLGLVEVSLSDKARRHVETLTDAEWEEQRRRRDHARRLDDWDRRDEERFKQATMRQHQLEDRKHLELMEGGYEQERLTAEMEAETERERLALEAEREWEHAAQQAEKERHAGRRELEAEQRSFEQERLAAEMEAEREREWAALDHEQDVDGVRRELEAARRDDQRSALREEVETLTKLLEAPQGAAALGMARGEVSSESVLQSHSEDRSQLVEAFYNLLRWLIDKDRSGDLAWDDSERQFVLGEIARLRDRWELSSGMTLSGERLGSPGEPFKPLQQSSRPSEPSDPADIGDDIPADVVAEDDNTGENDETHSAAEQSQAKSEVDQL